MSDAGVAFIAAYIVLAVVTFSALARSDMGEADSMGAASFAGFNCLMYSLIWPLTVMVFVSYMAIQLVRKR